VVCKWLVAGVDVIVARLRGLAVDAFTSRRDWQTRSSGKMTAVDDTATTDTVTAMAKALMPAIVDGPIAMPTTLAEVVSRETTIMGIQGGWTATRAFAVTGTTETTREQASLDWTAIEMISDMTVGEKTEAFATRCCTAVNFCVTVVVVVVVLCGK